MPTHNSILSDDGSPWPYMCSMLLQPVCVLEPGGGLVYNNPAWARLCGLSDEECRSLINSRHNLAASRSSDDAALATIITEALNGKLSSSEGRLKIPGIVDSQKQTVEVCGQPILSNDQSILGVLLTFVERGVSGSDALASHYDLKQLVAIVNASPDPIFIKDQNSRYTLMNQAFLDICKLTKEAEGKKDEELFPPEFVRAIRTNDDRVLTDGVVLRIEETLKIDGQSRLFTSLKFPLRDFQGRVTAMGAIASDITEQRNAEIQNFQLLSSERAAQEASNLKSHFLATVSHEIRTPLAGIIGLTDLLREKHPSGDVSEYADTINRTAYGLLRMVNDILDLSKLEAGKMQFEKQPFALGEDLEALLATLRPSAAVKDIALCLDYPTDIPGILVGDAMRLRQILTNLLGNAIKFSNATPVTLTVRRLNSLQSDAAVALEFAVSDSGIGMSAQAVQKLFQPFSQADASVSRRYGGTGLGLSISRILAEQMSGSIEVQSTPGIGSTFRLRLNLPVGHTIPTVISDRDEVPEEIHGTVLLVEDNTVNQTILAAMLKKIGLDMILAVDGETAVELCSRQKFDAVLMDCHMPGIDGLEATRRIRRLPQLTTCQLPIVALTANAMPDEKNRCIDAGMNDYLTKPVKLDVLRKTLALHMRSLHAV